MDRQEAEQADKRLRELDIIERKYHKLHDGPRVSIHLAVKLRNIAIERWRIARTLGIQLKMFGGDYE